MQASQGLQLPSVNPHGAPGPPCPGTLHRPFQHMSPLQQRGGVLASNSVSVPSQDAPEITHDGTHFPFVQVPPSPGQHG
jgi:hypothetical protein